MTIEDAWIISIPSIFNKNKPEDSLTKKPPKLIGRAEIITISGVEIIKI